jgi:hypothetical protein
MSVYHKWNTVFVQIPKNASESIHDALRNPTDDSHDHRTMIEILSTNDPELVENYFSFAVVRNPYARFVSCYEYMRQNSGYLWDPEFDTFLDDLYHRGPFFYTGEDIVWWPQHRFITVKNFVLVDKIIRFENLEEEWLGVISEINKKTPNNFTKPSQYLRRINVTSPHRKLHDNWQDYYTPESKEKLYKLYQKDFKMFGYEK